MDRKFLEETKMLNYKSEKLQKLIFSKGWNKLDEYGKSNLFMNMYRMRYYLAIIVKIH